MSGSIVVIIHNGCGVLLRIVARSIYCPDFLILGLAVQFRTLQNCYIVQEPIN